MAQIHAPWSEAQVAALNAYQHDDRFHPFTCGNGHGQLVAKADGWQCDACDYRQSWAHDFMISQGVTASEERVDRIFQDAFKANDAPLLDWMALRFELRRLRQENERLLDGKFTAEEIHGICHNLHGTVSAEAFADGCAAEQLKLYGCMPDRDRIAVVYGELDPAWARIRVDLFDCGPDVKSATRLFDEYAGMIVKLKIKHQPALDVKLVDVGYVCDDGDDADQPLDGPTDMWGFRCQPTNDSGQVDLTKDEMLVSFEDVESIGVY